MNKPVALFLDKTSLYPDDLDFSLLDEVARWQWFDNVSVTDIRHSLETAEIIVTNKVLLNKEVIDYCHRLKLICVAATGVNNIDLEAAKYKNIKVCNVRSYATPSVSQHVFSLVLALNRKLFSYKDAVNNGGWSHSDFFCYFGAPVSELQGKTLGIIGYGELGQAVAKIARCFGMKVKLAKRDESDLRAERIDLIELLSVSDVVSLHCPLTDSNRHMIAEKELSVMKSDAILINTARGGLVDEKALLQALENKVIAGAALDVLEEEPPSTNHPLIDYSMSSPDNDNLIITPHIAWASRESRQRLVDEIAKNIQVYLQGQPRNLV